MMKETVLLSIPVNEFQGLIIDAVKSCLKYSKEQGHQDPDELLTTEETCKLLNITKSTLWKRTRSGKLQSYGQGRRVYYKKSEVLASLVPLKK